MAMAAAPAEAPLLAPAPTLSAPHTGIDAEASDGSLVSSPGFMAGVLLSCTALAVLLWVALAVQTKRHNRARAKALEEAAAKQAALAVPVVVIMPDESIEFGAKLFRSPSGGMRPIEYIRAAAKQAAPAAAPLAAQAGQASASGGSSALPVPPPGQHPPAAPAQPAPSGGQ